MTTTTKVVFRIFPKNQGGEVIAIFPRDCGTNNPATCSSYMRVGQHASCSPRLLSSLRLATPAEYADLKHELENYGPDDAHYRLDIRKKCTRFDYEERERFLALRPESIHPGKFNLDNRQQTNKRQINERHAEI